jgi:hypothetical protein
VNGWRLFSRHERLELGQNELAMENFQDKRFGAKVAEKPPAA